MLQLQRGYYFIKITFDCHNSFGSWCFYNSSDRFRYLLDDIHFNCINFSEDFFYKSISIGECLNLNKKIHWSKNWVRVYVPLYDRARGLGPIKKEYLDPEPLTSSTATTHSLSIDVGSSSGYSDSSILYIYLHFSSFYSTLTEIYDNQYLDTNLWQHY